MCPAVVSSDTVRSSLLDGGIVLQRVYTPPRMQPKLNRAELDRLAEYYGLEADGVHTLLDIAGARPGRRASLHFLSRMLFAGGVLSLAAGVVFFVAANWSRFEVFGRFALIEALLVACVVAALIRPPPAILGRAALFLAFICTGALLALFGQTYQTGADVYELFTTWALLGLPLAVLSFWSASAAAWILVLNTALVLYCGWQPQGGLLWAMLGARRLQTAEIIAGCGWLNLALWFLIEWRPWVATPSWVRRLTLSCAFGYITWAGVLAAVESGEAGYAALAVPIAMIAVALYALRRRTDIYPVAVVMGTFIIVSMVWLANVSRDIDEGILLLMALWLIGTSTAAGRVLTLLARRWRAEGAA